MPDSTFSGSKFYICETAQESDLANQAAFELLTFVQVSKVVTFPEASVTESILENLYIDTTGITPARKGSTSGDESDIEIGFDSDDVGQVALRGVSDTKYAHAFKMEFNDIASGGSTNTIIYGRALFAKAKVGSGGADDFVTLMVKIKIQQLLTVDAT